MRTKVPDEKIQEELEYCRAKLALYNLHFSIKEIRGSSRVGKLNGIRALIIVLLRERRKYSFGKIGYILNRDHTTVLHLLKNYETFSSGRLEDFNKIKTALVTAHDKVEMDAYNAHIMAEIKVYEAAISNLKAKLK